MALNRGYLEGIASNVLWGTTFLATHEVLASWRPATSSALRFGIASCALLIALKLARYPIARPTSHEAWKWVMLTAVLGFGVLYPLQSKGLTVIPTGLSAIIMLTAPFFLVTLTAALGNAVPARKWVAIAVGAGGGAILVASRQSLVPRGGESALAGIAMTFAAALCLAISSLTTKGLWHISTKEA